MLVKVKILIARIICSNVFGNLIGFFFNNIIPSLSIKGVKINTSSVYISPRIKAQIFFGIYESAEYRFCDKYVGSGKNIIELGSSIGVISSFLLKYKAPTHLIAVEANPNLPPVINANFILNSGKDNFTIINKAIGENSFSKLWFSKGTDNTTGMITNFSNGISTQVSSISFSDLVNLSGFQKFILICDIEGGEIDVLNECDSNLEFCELLIIEIHEIIRNGVSYSINDIILLIEKRNFEVIDNYGNSFVFQSLNKI